MKKPFLQVTDIPVSNAENLTERIDKALRTHYNRPYTCQKTADGCFLKPVFRNVLCRNSFVLEYSVVVSQKDNPTTLQIQGKLPRFVLFFIIFWLAAVAFLEMVVLATAVTSGLDTPILFFVPVAMFVFGYLFCELGTKFAFRNVVKAIQTGLQ